MSTELQTGSSNPIAFSRDNSSVRSTRRRGGPSSQREGDDKLSLLEKMQQENKTRLQFKLEETSVAREASSRAPPSRATLELEEPAALSPVSSDSDARRRPDSLQTSPTQPEDAASASTPGEGLILSVTEETVVEEVPEQPAPAVVEEATPTPAGSATPDAVETPPRTPEPVLVEEETQESAPAEEPAAAEMVLPSKELEQELSEDSAHTPVTEQPAAEPPLLSVVVEEPKVVQKPIIVESRKSSNDTTASAETKPTTPTPVVAPVAKRRSTVGEKPKDAVASKPERIVKSRTGSDGTTRRPSAASPIHRRASAVEDPPRPSAAIAKADPATEIRPRVWAKGGESTKETEGSGERAAPAATRTYSPPAARPTPVKRGALSRDRVQSSTPVRKSGSAVAPTPVRRPAASCKPNLRSTLSEEPSSRLNTSRARDTNTLLGATEVSERRRQEAIQSRKQREKAAEQEKSRRMESTLRRRQPVEKEDKPDVVKASTKTTEKLEKSTLESSQQRQVRRKSLGAMQQVPVTKPKATLKSAPHKVSKTVPEEPVVTLAPFCASCGHKHVDENAKFCAMCGERRLELPH